MNESTISSAEMSISTPLARASDDARGQVVLQRHRQPVVHVDLDGDEQELAHLQDRDAFHVSPRPSPCGPRRRRRCRSRRPWRRQPSRRSAIANASASVALVTTVAEIDAEVDDRLRDLRPDAADDAVGAHQPRRRDRLQQVLRDQRVDRRHAGDVDDRDRARRSRRCAAAGSPSRPACARCRACRSAAARGRRPTA